MFCPECGEVTGTGPLDTRFFTEATRQGVVMTPLAGGARDFAGLHARSLSLTSGADRNRPGPGVRTMHEYGDPFTSEAIDAAVSRVLGLQRTQPGEPLDRHVEQALHETVCSCAIDIEDQIEGGRSGLHQSIAQEVHDKAELALLRRAEWSAPLDKVDQASDQSFPASDPPGWI